MADDAVFVFCNLTAKGETCIFPDKDRAVLPSYIQWRKEDDTDWYSNLKDGFKVTYDSIGTVQMTFLRLLSQEGYQNFTYKCINSAAWFNAELKNFDSAIKFLGDNEMEIGYDTDKLKPNILVDGCKVTLFRHYVTIPNDFPLSFSISLSSPVKVSAKQYSKSEPENCHIYR